jgi:hypothetical protein
MRARRPTLALIAISHVVAALTKRSFSSAVIASEARGRKPFGFDDGPDHDVRIEE